jgi:hypothetical protein
MSGDSHIEVPLMQEPTMATKKRDLPQTQLTLFDRGLEAPETMPTRRPRSKRVVAPVVEEVRSVDKVEILQPRDRPREPEPSAFERESYKLYLQLALEVRGLSIKTATATLVVALVVFGAQIDRTIFGLLELKAVNHTIVVGVVAWITIAMAAYTLVRGAFALKKKHDCGVFYQRVLHFSSNPIMRLLATLGMAVYVGLVIGAIVLTLILARQEMLDLVWFIVRNFHRSLIGPWETELLPVK